MLSLSSITMNYLISDIPIQDINCSMYTNTTISYPLQSPKYWTNVFPGGTWTNTCDVYIWSGLNNGSYLGAWDTNTLTAQCALITTLINNSDGGVMVDGGPAQYNCVMFNNNGGTDGGTDGGTFMNMSIPYSSICNSGSKVGAQYLPTLTGYTSSPIEYGYCSSVNMNYYNNSANYSHSSGDGWIFDSTFTTPSTWCDESSCSACQWTFNYDPTYFNIPGTANNFSSTCNNSTGQFGIWASHKNNTGNNGNYAQFVIGTNTSGSPSHTNAGAFIMQGSVSIHDSQGVLLPGLGCYANDNQCNLYVVAPYTSNSMCYGTDEIQLNQPGQGWMADYVIITDGCYNSYADKSGIISSTVQ